MAKVSIITPTYKRTDYSYPVLNTCIGSVRSQIHTDWEHLIISDGPDDPEVQSYLATINDPRIQYHSMGQKVGNWGNPIRQYGLDRAVGDYVCFLDDDNIIYPNYFERMISTLDANPQVGFAICKIMHNGSHTPNLQDIPWVCPGLPIQFGLIDTLNVVVRRSIMQACGWHQIGYGADYVTVNKLATMATWIYIPEILGYHL